MQEVVSRVRGWPASKNILVLIAYVLLTFIMTWPVIGRLGTAFPASDGDAWIHLWTFDWVKEALLSGQDPLYTDLLFYPKGVSLLYHNIAWLHIAAWLPLQAIVGAEAAYSLVFLAIFVLNGFATYLLAQEITRSATAAFVGGLIAAFWPYTLSHHNHPNLILIAWIPLALLYLIRFFDRRQLRDALLSAIFIALIGLTRWQLLVIGGLLIGAYILYRLATDRQGRSISTLAGVAGIGLLSVLLMAPLLTPVVVAQFERENPEELFVDEEVAQTDLLAYLVPSRYHPIWGEAAFRLTENFGVNRVFVPFLGYTVLALAILGLLAGWPKSLFWALVALLYLMLALGSDLQVNGRIIAIPMPYELIEDLFLIKIIRHPDRLNVVLSIPVAILASMGTVALLQHKRVERWSLALAALVAALILSEFVVHYPTFPVEIPDWYTELAKEPGEFGLLGVPMASRASPDKAYMYYQTRHKKPLVEGHVSRPPENAFAFIDSVPLLRSLRPENVLTPEASITNVSEQLSLLAAANIRYLVLHKQYLSTDDLASWRKWLVQAPLHEDQDLVVYRTDPQLGRDFHLGQELMASSDSSPGIGLVQATVMPTQTLQGGTVQVAAVWAAGSKIDQDHDFCLSLVDDRKAVVQHQCQPLAPEWPTSLWQANEIVSGDYALQLGPYLSGGQYTVTVTLQDQSGAQLGISAPIGNLALTAQPREFSLPDPANQVDIRWDGKMNLIGYDLTRPDTESVAVTLYWLAADRMDTSYTNFLHLVDPVTDQIVAQADVIPRGWSYPTNWWEKGEVVADTVLLSLTNVPPGEYALNVGWYTLESGERLSVSSAPEASVIDNAVFLTNIQRDSQE